MSRFRLHGLSAVALCVAVLASGCPKKETPPDPNVKTQAEIEQEAEAARRNEQATALQDRASRLGQSVTSLIDGAGSDGQGLPGAVGSGLDLVRAKAAEVEQLTAALAGASGDAWEGAKNRLEAALGELDGARETASQKISDWRQREAAALAAREDSGSPINPETGLIEGLDGGQYEQYVIPAVEKVQTTLRDMGLYAGPVDGVFDTPTLEAVGAFQERESLPKSGVPSPVTRSRLYSADG